MYNSLRALVRKIFVGGSDILVGARKDFWGPSDSEEASVSTCLDSHVHAQGVFQGSEAWDLRLVRALSLVWNRCE